MHTSPIVTRFFGFDAAYAKPFSKMIFSSVVELVGASCNVAATGSRRARSVSHASFTAWPLRSAPLDAAVADVFGTLSVRVFMMRTASAGRPSSRIATLFIFV